MAGLDEGFLNWFAGFWEGEGWISTRAHPSPYHRAEIGIKQKDRTPLDLIKSKFGGTITEELHHKKFRIWKWHITSRSEVVRVARGSELSEDGW